MFSFLILNVLFLLVLVFGYTIITSLGRQISSPTWVKTSLNSEISMSPDVNLEIRQKPWKIVQRIEKKEGKSRYYKFLRLGKGQHRKMKSPRQYKNNCSGLSFQFSVGFGGFYWFLVWSTTLAKYRTAKTKKLIIFYENSLDTNVEFSAILISDNFESFTFIKLKWLAQHELESKSVSLPWFRAWKSYFHFLGNHIKTIGYFWTSFSTIHTFILNSFKELGKLIGLSTPIEIIQLSS